MYLFSIWPSKCVCSSESRNPPRQLLSTKVMWHSYQKPPTDSLTICHPKTGDRRSVLTSLWFLEQQSCDFSPTHPLLPPGWKQIVLNMVFVWSTRTLGTDEQILLLGLTPGRHTVLGLCWPRIIITLYFVCFVICMKIIKLLNLHSSWRISGSYWSGRNGLFSWCSTLHVSAVPFTTFSRLKEARHVLPFWKLTEANNNV